MVISRIAKVIDLRNDVSFLDPLYIYIYIYIYIEQPQDGDGTHERGFKLSRNYKVKQQWCIQSE